MSWELVNRITVKKDGVYLSSKSSNCSEPYSTHKIDALSKIYEADGQLGLDREIIKMAHEYIKLRGNHKSIERYKNVLSNWESEKIIINMRKEQDDIYETLSQEDRNSIWGREKTEKAKYYLRESHRLENEAYEKIAQLCAA